MGGVLLWRARRLFVKKSLIKVWWKSVRDHFFVHNLNGFGIQLSGSFHGATFGSRYPREKKFIMRLLTLNDVNFGPVYIKCLFALLSCMIKRKEVSNRYDIRISSVVLQRTCHYIIVYSDGKNAIFKHFSIQTTFGLLLNTGNF